MKLKFSLFLLVAALMAMLTPRAAHADLGYWSAALVGNWKNPKTGEIYRFNSDATFTLTSSKPTEEAVIASSGWWKIVQPTEKESGGSMEGPVALLIKTRKITLQEPHGLRHTESVKMDYRLVVDIVGAPGEKNRDLYRIDGTEWKRVKTD